MQTRVKVWDVPTRLFHWTLALLCADGWVSFKFGDIGLVWHRYNGYAVLTLVLFRLGWGLVGSSTARFSNFLTMPQEAVRYLVGLARGRTEPHLGHNPAGGWMVVTLLVALLGLAGCGLFATDDIMTEGPLAHLVSSRVESMLTTVHKSLFWVIAGLVVVHVAAVLFHQFLRGEPLVAAMVSGLKPAGHAPEETSARWAPPWAAALCLAAAGGLLAGILRLAQ